MDRIKNMKKRPGSEGLFSNREKKEKYTEFGLVIGFIGLLKTQLMTTIYRSLSHKD
jgi:hypothetical protein